MSEDYYKLVKEPIEKFQYAFAGLSFVSLSFSIQFHVKDTSSYLVLLVISWILFFLSGWLAGKWLINSTVMSRLNYQMNLSERSHSAANQWMTKRDKQAGEIFKWQIRCFLAASIFYGTFTILNIIPTGKFLN